MPSIDSVLKTSSNSPEAYEGDDDNDKTPTKGSISGSSDVTPNETINDITDMQNTLKVVKRVIEGKVSDKKALENVKEEYSSYFDKDSGNATEKEAFSQIKDYLEGELYLTLGKAKLSGLDKALKEVYNKQVKSSENTSTLGGSKTAEGSTSNVSLPEANIPNPSLPKANIPGDNLSPLNYVIDKQSTDPYDPTDDLD